MEVEKRSPPEASLDGRMGEELGMYRGIVPAIHRRTNTVSSRRCGMPDLILALEILDMNIDSSRSLFLAWFYERGNLSMKHDEL